MKTDGDVVIVGGGLAGLSLAALLAQANYKVLVLESGKFPKQPPGDPGLRVSAVSHASQALLSAAGAWLRIPDQHLTPYRSMRVWDASVAPFSDRSLTFSSDDLNVDNLGHIVPNSSMQWALIEALNEAANVTMMDTATVVDVLIENQSVRVFCENHQQYVAQLLVGADGAQSKVRELNEIGIVRKNYPQVAVVCEIETELPHQDTAWQRFLPNGPLALLPLSPQRCSIVWSTTIAEARRLQDLAPSDFARELEVASDHVLGCISVPGKRAGFPLSMHYANRYVGKHLALIGDAAHVVHPLAGQGANMGLADVVELVRVLEAGTRRGDRCGDLRALRQYERARKYENRKMLLALDGVHQIFANSQPWLVTARTLGMGAVNSAAWLKNRLAREALG